MFVYRWEHDARTAAIAIATMTAIRMMRLMVEYIDPTSGAAGIQDHHLLRADAAARAEDAAGEDDGEPAGLAVRGRGPSIVDGKSFDWKKFDTLAVPGGSWFEHVNDSSTRPAVPVRRLATSRR